MKIGVFDSGKGGMSVLEELLKILPEEDFLYYGDSLNIPYGEKSDEELFDITSGIVEYLNNRGCKIIVIACNTATTRCMKNLRLKYPDIIFVGIVPVIKMACDYNFKNILVMATSATIGSCCISELIHANLKREQNIYLASCDGLACAIEREEEQEIKRILRDIFQDYKDKNIDSIVLGCTHYLFIKKEILEEMPGVVLLDGANGVAREVKRQLELHDLLKKDNSLGSITIYNSLYNKEIQLY